jgi:predicted RNA binding protein YcfA (HicA-like mRNA interferase family)
LQNEDTQRYFRIRTGKKLKPFGYFISRQTGSHIRISTEMNGLHTVTIPDHKQLRIGTISSILHEVAQHFNLSKEEFVKEFFDK